QFYFLQVIHEMYPQVELFEQNPKRYAMFDKVCGSKEIRERFIKRYKVADMADYWNKDAEAFQKRSASYYLYNPVPKSTSRIQGMPAAGKTIKETKK
ncbi:MAG: DUF1343 domain-containing protein, partial [Muribaculaceae bacterium]|nr:DUF1343 domain-containing protein [Muribaculaceae bacterium]